MTQKKRGRGRPPKDGVRAMTDAERQRRYRERLRQKQAPEEQGLGPRYAPFAEDEAALRKARAQINEAAAATTDPIRSLVLEARYAAVDSLMWMGGLANSIFAGEKRLRGKSFQTHRRVAWVERTLRKLEEALDERDAAAPAPTSSVDPEGLQDILKKGRYRLDAARMQVGWLHEEIGDFAGGKYPPEITGPAFQMGLCLAGWQEMVDETEALLPRKPRRKR